MKSESMYWFHWTDRRSFNGLLPFSNGAGDVFFRSMRSLLYKERLDVIQNQGYKELKARTPTVVNMLCSIHQIIESALLRIELRWFGFLWLFQIVDHHCFNLFTRISCVYLPSVKSLFCGVLERSKTCSTKLWSAPVLSIVLARISNIMSCRLQ